MSRFLIACGGTGGHLSPGIALAEGLAGAFQPEIDADAQLFRMRGGVGGQEMPVAAADLQDQLLLLRGQNRGKGGTQLGAAFGLHGFKDLAGHGK